MTKLLIFAILNCSFLNFVLSQINNPYQLKSTFQSGDAVSNIEVAANGDTVLNTRVNLKNTVTNNIEISEKIYKGTPLFGNSWFSQGVIYLAGKPTKGNIAYNLVNRDVQFSINSMNNVNSIKPDSFIINNIKFVKIAEGNTGYCQEIFSNSKSKLLRQFNCNYRPKSQGQNTGYEMSADNYEGVYVKSTSLYWLENELIKELKPNKSVFKNFGEKKDLIEKYAKERDLNVKKETDLIEMVKYFNSIN